MRLQEPGDLCEMVDVLARDVRLVQIHGQVAGGLVPAGAPPLRRVEVDQIGHVGVTGPPVPVDLLGQVASGAWAGCRAGYAVLRIIAR
jgi:hypothetical protein